MLNKFKKIFVVLLTVCIMLTVCPTRLFSITASAETTTHTEGFYTFTVTDGNATITDVSNDISGDVTIPSTLGGYPVTSIGSRAFYDCSSLMSVTIPDSVTSIGSYAFYGCDSLTSLTIPEGLTSVGYGAFDYCYALEAVYITDLAAWCNISFGGSSANPLSRAENLYLNGNLLTDLVIPNNVNTIGNYSFNNCTSITSVTIPNSVTSIGMYAFCSCDSLTNVTIGNGVTSIGDDAFCSCDSLTNVTIGNGVTSIGDDAFFSCNSLEAVYITDLAAWCNISLYDFYSDPLRYAENLYLNGNLVTSLVIPDGVTNISDYAFNNCTSITSVTIPDSVISIGMYAFSSCDSLTNVTIGNGVTRIGYHAFRFCDSLTSITIPNSVTSIGYGVFSDCLGIEKITVDVGNDIYFSYGNCLIETATNTLLLGCENSVIPNGVTCIGYKAFSGCTGLKSISIPDSVTSIGNEAFYKCSGLTSITIPNSVTYLGDYALAHCTGLTNITIPNGSTDIGSFTFRGCTSLKSITIPEGVVSIGKNAFLDCTNLTTVNYNAINCTSMGSEDLPVFEGCTGLTTIKIGEKVEKIPAYAFEGCENLNAVHINDIAAWFNISFGNIRSNPLYCAKNLYLNDSLVTNLVIPNGVTNIGDYAFYNCTSITSVTIPDSVTSIGRYAFEGCENLESVYITDLTAWCNISFKTLAANPLYYAENLYLNGNLLTDLVIPNEVTNIGSLTFRGCTSLKSITIPEGVVSIGKNAFLDCTNLTTVNYNAINCTSMGSYSNPVFSGCTGLTTLKIGEKVEKIPEYAFYDCTSLVSVTLSNSVTNIGSYAFDGCENLQSVYITDLAAWCNISFNNVRANPLIYAEKLYLDNSLITDLVIPDDITEIKNYTFWGCSCFESVTIPNSVTSIGNSAFIYCTNLTHLDIGNGVTTIGYQAFRDCSNLTSITISDGLTNIDDGAFLYCDIDTVWYRGSQEDRNKIHFDSGNYNLTNANWFYDICAKDKHIFTINENLTCEVCGYSKSPDKPILESKTNNSVTLKANEIFEYSKDRINWQDNNVFTDLSNCGTCSFYQRIKSSNISTTGETSAGLTVSFKIAQTTIPAAPSISSFTDSQVILVPVTDCEYSIDGLNWQTSNVFGNLLPAQNYTFFQRYAETDTYEASDKSIGTTITTDKAKQTLIPNAPTVHSFTKSSITLNVVEGCEYSKDGTTWQESNVFSGLECGTEYTFYQRYKETDTTYTGKCSSALKAKTEKGIQTPPEAPTIISFSDTMVTLKIVSGCEYSSDGTNWQTSNVFTGLCPVTTYTFYQRYTETEKYQTSAKSNATIQKTDKAKQTLIPNAPTVQSSAESSITLVTVNGCEYSKDGINWQSSNVFSGLFCGTEYTFYQRYKETATTYVGKSSAALVTRTDKGTQTAPSAPTLENKTHNSVTLTKISGCEYSRDGINWQTSNVFTGLTPETNYMFYQRKAENDRYYVSSSSSALIVRTLEQPQYTPGDIDGVEGVTDADAVYLLYHTFLSDIYPVNQDCDFNGDGEVNDKDAVYLLYHTFLPDLYPIN